MSPGERGAPSRVSDAPVGFGIRDDADTIDLIAPFRIFWDHKRLIVIVTAIVVALAVVVALSLPPRFTAIAQIALNNQERTYIDIEGVVAGPEIEDEVVAGEISAILSNDTLRRVITGLRLDLDIEFGAAQATGVWSYLPDWLGGGTPATHAEAAPTNADVASFMAEQMMDDTIRSLRRSLEVTPVGNSYVINVSASATTPRKAALIANAVANAYILVQFEQRQAEIDRANDWFGERLSELRASISLAEDEVEKSRTLQLQAFGESEAALSARLEEVSRQLALAQSERIVQEARYERIEASRGDRKALAALPEVLVSGIADRLRSEVTSLNAERARLLTRYGDDHPEVTSLDAKASNLLAALDDEIDRIVVATTTDMLRAQSIEARHRAGIQALELDRVRQQQASVELRSLEAEVETNREIYLNFLTRFREVNKTASLVQPDAVVISDARPPQFGSGLSRRLIVVLSGILGVGLGCLLALTFEALNRNIRSSEQVEKLFDLRHLGSLPRVVSHRWQRRPLFAEGHQPRVMTEGLLSLSMTLRQMLSTDQKVIGITSADAGAGKSALSAMLAEMVVKADTRVLLLECDIHRPKLGHLVLQEASRTELKALSDAASSDKIAGGAGIKEVLPSCITSTDYGFDFLNIGGPADKARRFIARNALVETLDILRDRYDIILVNLPPILPVSDTLRIVQSLDSAIMVVRWNYTARTALHSALKKAGDLRDRFRGFVFSDVDPKRAQADETALLALGDY